MDEPKHDEEASWAAMYSLLSDRSSSAYDAFESFLEQPNNRFCAPNEGESLLRLHTQLDTLASIMEFATLDEQTFRADASTILSKALETLPGTLPATHDGQRPVLVRRSAQQVLTNLEWCANMDVVEPLRETIIARLVQLHSAFLVSGTQQAARQTESAQSSPITSRFSATMPRTDSPEPHQLGMLSNNKENRLNYSSTDSDLAPYRYEPRRKTPALSPKPTLPQSGTQTPPRAPSVPPVSAGGAVMGPPSGLSRPMSVPPRTPSAQPKAPQMVVPGHSADQPPGTMQRSSTDLQTAHTGTDSPQPSAATSTVISITDISANADSGRSMDLRTFEVMISVEGMADTSDAASAISPDGFVLVRRWHEFEQMDVEIQRQPRSSHPLPRLPAVKGRRSADACRLLEAYLFDLLQPSNRAQMASISGAKSFFDRTRAGASAEDLRRKGGPGAFLGGIGKGIVSGVNSVGKQAARTSSTGVQAISTATGFSDGLPAPRRPSSTAHSPMLGSGRSPDGASRFVVSSPNIDTASSTTSAFVSRTNSPSPSPSRRTQPAPEMSARQLDMLLSSVFAVADEAFNLQGGWTLRRGMLRVLEQVVRTTYASSIVAGFNNAAASLNVGNFARWIEDLTNSLWPNGRRWGSEIGTADEKPPRTEKEKLATREKAREIVVSYAPAQAGYLLGPGGKVACVKALAEVHATLMDPITASDLGLTVVLKALDMASR
uniref:Sorting nexin C-terminal domain-containing protein n=2 Tax=Kalmanozyma brasiliensis (strain GHG001) TaxID=1365824 RepID=V5GNA2_KALBG